MKFLAFLPLIAATLAVSLMLISPLPVEVGRGFEKPHQGRSNDHGESRADFIQLPDQQHQKRIKNSLDSRPKQFYGSRRDPATGFWSPYR